LLLPQASCDDAMLAATRIREEFYQASATLLRRAEGVTMSIGVASLKLCGATHTDQLVNRADQALYQSKADGRNRTSVARSADTNIVFDPPAAPAGALRPAPIVGAQAVR